MEFLDINLTKDSRFLLHAQTLLLVDLKKTILYSGFKNPYKKNPPNMITRVSSWIAFCSSEKREWKTRQKLESEKTQVYARKPRQKMPFKNSISFLARKSKKNFRVAPVSKSSVCLTLEAIFSHVDHKNFLNTVDLIFCSSLTRMLNNEWNMHYAIMR